MTKGAAPGHVRISAALPDTVTDEDACHVTPHAGRQTLPTSPIRFQKRGMLPTFARSPHPPDPPAEHTPGPQRWKHHVFVCL